GRGYPSSRPPPRRRPRRAARAGPARGVGARVRGRGGSMIAPPDLQATEPQPRARPPEARVGGRGRARSLLRKNYGYHLARLRAGAVRRLYEGPFRHRLTAVDGAPRELDVDYLAFSGERDVLEQLASLQSFIRYVGRPGRVLLGSDGTHTLESLRLLRRLHDGIEVIPPAAYVADALPD